jgi:hypothetical protein
MGGGGSGTMFVGRSSGAGSALGRGEGSSGEGREAGAGGGGSISDDYGHVGAPQNSSDRQLHMRMASLGTGKIVATGGRGRSLRDRSSWGEAGLRGQRCSISGSHPAVSDALGVSGNLGGNSSWFSEGRAAGHPTQSAAASSLRPVAYSQWMQPQRAQAANFQLSTGSRTFDHPQQQAQAVPPADAQHLRELPAEQHQWPLQHARFSPTPLQQSSFDGSISGSGAGSGSVGPSSVQKFGGSVMYGGGQWQHCSELDASGGSGGTSGGHGGSSSSVAFQPQAWPGLAAAPVLNDPAADPFAADWHEENW